jgi:glycosyltransferase involved in cell wall biosynthesis
MHILILADPIDNQKAGVHIYTKRLVENFLKIDKKTTFSFIHERKNSFFKGLNHYIIPKKSFLGYGTYRKFFLIPRLIRKLKPDIVLEPCHIGPFRLPKVTARAVTIHDLTPLLYPQFHIRRSTIIHKLLLKSVLRKANLILTASQTTASDIDKYCPEHGPITTIPLGIDPPQKPTKNPINKPYILYLGTIEPRKNLETLISAFSELKKSNKIPHKLVLAGATGWKADHIATLAAKNSDIILTDHLSDTQKAAYLSHTDLFIYPSIYEGFGLPPLEAMSYRTPVICSTGGSLAELYENYALTFPPKNKKQLKHLILKSLAHPNTKLTEKAFNYSKSFTWPLTARKTLQALKSTAK